MPATTEIDVMVAWTPQVAAAVYDPLATAEAAVAVANDSYVNSGVHIHLNLVATTELSYDESGKTYDQMLADFTAMPQAQIARNSFGADIAALLVNNSAYCGESPERPEAPLAYSFVWYSCAVGNFSLAHEWGHTFGATHAVDDPQSNGPYPYGHGYRHNPDWRTIMAYSDGTSTPRIKYWSNPNIQHPVLPSGTVAMGDPATADNARVLNENAQRVAAFSSRPKKIGGLVMCFGTVTSSQICVAVPVLMQPFQIGPIPEFEEPWLAGAAVTPENAYQWRALATVAGAAQALPPEQRHPIDLAINQAIAAAGANLPGVTIKLLRNGLDPAAKTTAR